MRICELREKEVINIRDCQRLGRVLDIEFDLHTGVICQLILPVPVPFLRFLRPRCRISDRLEMHPPNWCRYHSCGR